jgi:hypothetical protein
MSRSYRVKWKSCSTLVETEEGYHMPLAMLDILPPAEMAELLREQLLAAGWQKDGDSVRKRVQDVEVRMGPKAEVLELTARKKQTATAQGPDDKAAQLQLREQSKLVEQAIKQQAAQELNRVEPAIRKDFQEILQKVYVEALKKRASGIGQIESMMESRDEHGAMELTIKVKL